MKKFFRYHTVLFCLMSLFVAAWCSFMGGCASASVRNMYQSKTTFYSPKVIYVQPYQFQEHRLAVDRSGDHLDDFQKELSGQLAQDLRKDLQKIFPSCQILGRGTPPPQGPYWLITGSFDNIRQGSRILRGTIGCGLGKTRLDVTTHIYGLARENPELFYTIETTASSAGMPGFLPGAVLLPVAPAAITGAWQAGTSGLSFDTRRTSRETTAAISQYLYQRGALSEKQLLRYKRTGR